MKQRSHRFSYKEQKVKESIGVFPSHLGETDIQADELDATPSMNNDVTVSAFSQKGGMKESNGCDPLFEMIAPHSRLLASPPRRLAIRCASTPSNDEFEVALVGGGSGRLTVANQIYRRFKAAGQSLNYGDIVVLDATKHHNYQVCHY